MFASMLMRDTERGDVRSGGETQEEPTGAVMSVYCKLARCL